MLWVIIKGTLSLAKRKQHLLLPSLINSIDNTFDSPCSFHQRLSTGFISIYPPVLLDRMECPAGHLLSQGPQREVGTAAIRLQTMI